MYWAQFKDNVSHMCVAGTVVATWYLTKEVAGSSPFNDKYFITENIKEKLHSHNQAPVTELDLELKLIKSYVDLGNFLPIDAEFYVT